MCIRDRHEDIRVKARMVHNVIGSIRSQEDEDGEEEEEEEDDLK